jgi:DNA polymerase-1
MPNRNVILDTECNGLRPTKIHCIVVLDIDTKEVFSFVQEECYTKFPKWFKEEVKAIYGHNLIGYDIPYVLSGLLHLDIELSSVTDTLILSQLSYSDRYIKDVLFYGGEERIPKHYKFILRDKPHSLAAWGIRVGRYKPDIDNWDEYTPEMLNRCTEDCFINLETLKRLTKELEGFSQYSIRLEHRVAQIINEQCRYGVKLDKRTAEEMYHECKRKADIVRQEITKDIPPFVYQGETVVPKIKEIKVWTGEYEVSPTTGRKVKVYETHKVISSQNKGYKLITEAGFPIRGPYSLIEIEPFNPDSADQRLKVLNSCGWNPVNFNKPSEKMKKEGKKRGNPKTTDEENLDTIPDSAPQGIKKLAQYIMYTNRHRLAASWMELSENSEGRIYASVNSIGTPTGRMRHYEPNLGNIVSVEDVDKFKPDEVSKFLELKSKGDFFPIPSGYPYAGNLLKWKAGSKPVVLLIGEQGKYGWECRKCFTVSNPDLYELVGFDAASLEIRMLAHYMNDKAFTYEVLNGDIYTKIQEAVGLPTRRKAKETMLALIYGAADTKLGSVNGTNARGGRIIREKIMDFLPELKKLIERVQREAQTKGYLIGLDGRKLWVRKPHAALNTLLQSAGAIVMKKCLVDAYKEINLKQLPARFVLNVHDEFQLETMKTVSDEVGNILVSAIVAAGVFFKMNIEMGGEYRKGSAWCFTH